MCTGIQVQQAYLLLVRGLTILESSGQIFEKYWNVKFNEKSFQLGDEFFHADGKTSRS
jgi:hypothetical protein